MIVVYFWEVGVVFIGYFFGNCEFILCLIVYDLFVGLVGDYKVCGLILVLNGGFCCKFVCVDCCFEYFVYFRVGSGFYVLF